MGLMLKKPANDAGKTLPAILIGLFVAFGGVLFGYDTGSIGGILAMPYWLSHFATGYTIVGAPAITSQQKSLIVSLLSVGTFFGSLFSAPIADTIGRRWAMIVNASVFCLGVALQTASTHIPLFIGGRVVAGLGVGLLSATIPLYQSETAPKWIRGTIVGCYQFSITIGILLATIVLNATQNRKDSGSYRIPLAVQFAFALIIICGMFFLPETPRYMIKRGDNQGAAKSLARLRQLPVDHPAIVEELAEIQANHEFELDIGTSYFKQSGISDAFIVSVITGTVNVASTIPGLYLVESWGRRPLLIFGAVGMSVCQLIVASVGTALPGSDVANKVLIAFVCIYIFFFACSWGVGAWIVCGETFPLKARAKGLSITIASNWLLNFIIGYVTPYLVDPGKGNADLGSKVFFIWGGFCVICIVFVYFFIYETKGLSLEQVDELYEKFPSARTSQNFIPTVSFTEVAGLGAADGRRRTLAEYENEAVRRKSDAGVHTEEKCTQKV